MAKRIESKDLWKEQEIKKSAKALAVEIKKLETLLSSLSKSTANVRREYNQQSTSQNGLKKKSKELSIVQKELIKLDNQLVRAKAQLTNEYIQVQKAVLKEKEAVRQSNVALKEQLGIKKKTGGLFKTMTKSLLTAGAAFISVGAAVQGFIRFVKQAIEVNREFESSITDVITLLDEQQKLKYRDYIEQGAIDIAAEYGLEIKDVNKALFDAISAGVEVGNSIEFLRKNAVLAIGGVSDLGTAVDGTTNIMNAYGDEAGSVEEITSAMFAAQVEGKTNIQLLSSNIGKLAPIAANAKIPLNELLTTFAGMTKQLGSTEESATVVRQVISSLVKPSGEAEAVFDKLGIAVGTTAIQNDGLLNKLLEVSAAAEGNADVLVDLIPNIRAFTGVSALSAETIAELEESIEGLNDKEKAASLLQEAFNEKSKTGALEAAKLKGEYQKFLVTLGGGDSIFKKAGSAIRSELTGRLQGATEAVNVLQEGSWADKIKVIFTGLFKSLTVIIKPFLFLLEKITGKDLKFQFDTKSAEESIDKSIEIVKDGGKKLTEEQVKAEEDRQKKLQEIKERAEGLDTNKAVEEAKKTGIKLIEVALSTGEKIKVTEDQLTAFKEAELEKRTKLAEDWLNLEVEEATSWVDQQIENEKSITEVLKEEEKKRLEIKKENAEKELEIEEAKEDLSSALKEAAGQIATDRFNANIDNNLAAYQSENEAEQEILQNRLDKGEISEAKYKKEVAKLNKKYRIEEAKAEKKKALFDIFINTLIEVTKSLANPIKAAIIGGIGAANAIAVAARPLPKFYKGVKDFHGGMALVGDSQSGGSQAELVKLVSGEQFMVSGPTIMDLPKGASVFPEKSKETQAALGFSDNGIIKGLSRIEKKISGNGGGLYWTGKGLEKRDIINNNTTVLRGRRFK